MIGTLALGLILALLLGMLAQRIKLSPLVGYLVAGMLAAQPWWGQPVDSHIVEGFSHLGVILLLFGAIWSALGSFILWGALNSDESGVLDFIIPGIFFLLGVVILVSAVKFLLKRILCKNI